MEERLKSTSNVTSRTASEIRSISNGRARRQSFGGVEIMSKPSQNGFLSRKTNQSGASRTGSASLSLKKVNNLSTWFDGDRKSEDKDQPNGNIDEKDFESGKAGRDPHSNGIHTLHENGNGKTTDRTKLENEDYVSGALYDMLQKEVIALRKVCQERDQTLKDKDDAIEVYLCSLFFCNNLSFPP